MSPLEEVLEHLEIFTFKEAMKIKSKTNFIQVMEHEIKNHTSRNHLKCLPMNEVPCDKILRSTWTFLIKRNSFTGSIINFKARFCTYGKREELGINYNETCAPVVKWNTIRTFITLLTLNNWKTKAIDFDQECTQADWDTDMCVYLPAGFKVQYSQRCVIKLLKKLYILK